MKAEDFAEATGYLRAVEKRILTSSGIERVIDTPGCEEAFRMLSQNSELDFSALERVDDYEIVLKRELKRVYDMLYNICPHPVILDVLSAKYDYHNVKVAVKAYYLNKEDESLFIRITRNDPETIIDTVSDSVAGDLPEHLAEAVLAAKQSFEAARDPQMVDITVDRLMFAYMLGLCETIQNTFITEYVQAQVDFYNAKTLLRVKNMQKGLRFLENALLPGGSVDTELFLSSYDKPVEAMSETFYNEYFSDIMRETLDNYEKTGNYSEMEKLTDNYLINAAKQTMLVAFGPEPLFAYIVAKENEIKQIRILATCKLNNIRTEVLRERLRDNYA